MKISPKESEVEKTAKNIRAKDTFREQVEPKKKEVLLISTDKKKGFPLSTDSREEKNLANPNSWNSVFKKYNDILEDLE